MEPRPQKPRPRPQQGGAPPQGSPAAPQVGPDPTQQTQQYQPQQGSDPSAFVAPPRAEYDYSPLDLQPPGQRRKRQIIAGIIGALVVVAIGALIVAGWMALRDDDNNVDPTPGTDRVAQLNSTPTQAAAIGDGAPDANNIAPTVAPTTAPAAAPTSASVTMYDGSTIRTTLPVVESMPGPFTEGGDTPQDLTAVTDALGGTSDVQTMLADTGWQAAMTRTFTSSDPATTGTTTINVSSHAFKDPASAQAALPQYATILEETFGWVPVEGEQFGDGSRTLVWTNPDTGEDAVTIYVVDGQLLYRVFAIGPSGFDSTPNAIHVVNQLLGS